MIIKKTGKLKSIGIAAGVVGIFLGMQILIGVIFGLMGAVSGDYNAMMDSLYGNASLITAVADLAAAAVILLIFLCRGKNPFYEVGFRQVRFLPVPEDQSLQFPGQVRISRKPPGILSAFRRKEPLLHEGADPLLALFSFFSQPAAGLTEQFFVV